MTQFDIEFYKTPADKCPIQKFLDSLTPKMRAKVLRMILLLEEYGNELCEPYSKLLQDGIFELRAKQGSDITRVLYFFMTDRKIVLTHGFIKKTQRTPKKEIYKSRKYREDYLRRKAEEL